VSESCLIDEKNRIIHSLARAKGNCGLSKIREATIVANYREARDVAPSHICCPLCKPEITRSLTSPRAGGCFVVVVVLVLVVIVHV
jgi:hypothetical protein